MGVLLKEYTTLLLFVLILGAAAFSVPQKTFAADLLLTPDTSTVTVGGKLSVKVMLDPKTESVNAANGTITFDSALLSVDSISKDNSAFSLWTADPSYSNADGNISFSGGTPTAFSATKTILTIVFKGKAEGDAKVTFTDGSVLAADGKGTNVYKNGTGGTYTVKGAAATPPPEKPTVADTPTESAGDGATPIAPIVSSPTYPKPDTWYGTSTAVFTWVNTSDVTGIRTLISDKDNDTPKVALKGGATTTVTVTGIKDGISYFYVQAKNDYGWGEVGKMKVQVDTAPPQTFDITVQEPGADGGAPKLAFKTDDALSGMDHYTLGVGTSTPASVALKDVADGTYPVPPNPGGAQKVTIRAYDKAGNFVLVEKELTLPAVAKPKSASAVEEAPTQPQGSGFGLTAIILIIILALLVGALFTLNMYTKKTTLREKDKLLKAVVEVRDKNDRIFSAMREEFEKLINDFDAKPQLTPEERALLEEIKEVLDISEELVDTSIEDLKKMVRNQP